MRYTKGRMVSMSGHSHYFSLANFKTPMNKQMERFWYFNLCMLNCERLSGLLMFLFIQGLLVATLRKLIPNMKPIRYSLWNVSAGHATVVSYFGHITVFRRVISLRTGISGWGIIDGDTHCIFLLFLFLFVMPTQDVPDEERAMLVGPTHLDSRLWTRDSRLSNPESLFSTPLSNRNSWLVTRLSDFHPSRW